MTRETTDPGHSVRLCTRGITPATALARAHVYGDRQLAEPAGVL
ncbi:hypothetical protein [Streptomyces decoyicus]